MIYMSLFIVVLGLCYLTSLPQARIYMDLTANRNQTLSQASQRILKSIKKPLIIHTYVNVLDATAYMGAPNMHNKINTFFEPYMRFIPDIKIDYQFYYGVLNKAQLAEQFPGKNLQQIVNEQSAFWGIDPKEVKPVSLLREQTNLQKENFRFVWQLESGNRKTFLRIFDDVGRLPFEQEIASALKQLVDPSPRLVFLQGQNERTLSSAEDAGYQLAISKGEFRESLINKGFRVEAWLNRSFPKQVKNDILVIADPVVAFSEQELQNLKMYLETGGDLLVLGEPGRQDLLNPLLQQVGIRFTKNKLEKQSADFAADFLLPAYAKPKGLKDPSFFSTYLQELKTPVVMDGAVGITVTDLKYNWQPVLNHLSQHNTTPLAMSMSRIQNGKEQRILVLGDADVMSNAAINRSNIPTANQQFVRVLFRWLSQDDWPVDVHIPQLKDDELNLSHAASGNIRLLFLVLLPAIVAGLGSLKFIKRTRK